ncbi:aspartate kinase [Flaviaesturariibacter flavus]|uniref:Aspartokinase n=1 Tax=Flaviaesturariibacter flavus TaxID=2502780 RepID=A0A4V2NV81_9BACT|nr:aspartate kinase [Flaviaesturariibacter flavus]TCJ12416.1 aspartate kinase [Flaviaesturariibacter flavus]
MKIMKFGGTSVGKPQRMHEVARLITTGNEGKIVVLSAVSGTTNSLVAISQQLAKGDRHAAKALIGDLRAQYDAFVPELVQTAAAREAAAAILHEHFDFLSIILRISWSEALNKDILAQGELLSTKLFSTYLTEQGIAHALLPALDFMRIDAYEEPQLDTIRELLQAQLAQHRDTTLFITQGFICRNARGEVDNLKRGGSDYSASLMAAAITASVCEIWTDISGMHNNDPRVVERTVPIGQLSFDEAAELAYFGAKILHPASIWPAQQYRIPVRLLNTMEPSAPGTLITQVAAARGAKAIAAKDGITAVNIKSSRMLLAYGFLRKVFEVFEKNRTSIDMITTSEVAVSVTIDNDSALPEILEELAAFGTVSTDGGQTIISIVGHAVASDTSMLQRIFSSLEGVEIRMVSYGGSLHNISLLVDADKKKEVLQRLNKGVFNL